MTSKDRIEFLLVARVEGLDLRRSCSEGIQIAEEGDEQFSIQLAPAQPEKDALEHTSDLICRIRRSDAAPEKLCEFVQALNSRKFLPYEGMKIKLPLFSTPRTGRLLIAEDGSLQDDYRLNVRYYPPELQSLASKAHTELHEKASCFVRLLTWFFGDSESHAKIRESSIYLNSYEHVASSEPSASIIRYTPIIWDGTNSKNFEDVWRSAATEPLAQEMRREATSMMAAAPRSALLMLTSALEVGVKHYISRDLPFEGWLAMEAPSPPIVKILTKYVKELKTTEDVSQWKKLKPLFNRIQERNKDRNKVAHQGKEAPSPSKLKEYQKDVTDVLYILDYLSGQSWARHNVRPDTCKKLGWPEPEPPCKQRNMEVSVRGVWSE